MFISGHKLPRVLRVATNVALSFLICWGLLLVLAQIKPFGIDEWRLIYNLKYKNATQLWGQLELLQQFPRAYLEAIKLFTAPFDYSYFTLRFPSFVVGTLAIVCSFRLMNRIFGKQLQTRFLFVLIIASAPAFTEYFIQVKQYTMEILLSLLAIWQLLQVLEIGKGEMLDNKSYYLLCLTMLIAPFFSYTYPIAIAPAFVIAFIEGIRLLTKPGNVFYKVKLTGKLWFPFLLSATGIIIFYITDVSQLMKDNGMQLYWSYLMMHDRFDLVFFLKSFYMLFAEAGSGMLFQVIFGVVGLIAFIYAFIRCRHVFGKKNVDATDYLNFYCLSLITLVMILFIGGKIPIGEARLNSFTIPAIAILITSLVGYLAQVRFGGKLSTCLFVLLFAGVVGHIFTSSIKELLGGRQYQTLHIYEHTEDAIILAQRKKIPIFITSSVAYPYQKTINFPYTTISADALGFPTEYNVACCTNLRDNIPGDWVLKTFPAYKVNENTPVYALNSLNDLKACIAQLPPEITSVLAGDGTSFQVVAR
jgi:uncharacterized membrane protein YeaQ/YmgE (transglycosylase-associated protein family)